MKNLLVAFLWTVHSGGYRWQDTLPAPFAGSWPGAADDPGPWLMPQAEASRSYAATAQFTGLFWTFASLDLSMDAILRFAGDYGLLGMSPRLTDTVLQSDEVPPGNALACPESYSDWLSAIWAMRQAVGLWDMCRAGDQVELASYFRRRKGVDGQWEWIYERFPSHLDNERAALLAAAELLGPTRVVVASKTHRPELLAAFQRGDFLLPARVYLGDVVSEYLQGRLTPALACRNEEKGLILRLTPSSLLAAMWWQLALAIDEEKDYRQCQVCDRWFELSPETARTSRMFCSGACRFRAYRARKAKARELNEKGKSLAAIACELESDVATVKKWVGTGKSRRRRRMTKEQPRP